MPGLDTDGGQARVDKPGIEPLRQRARFKPDTLYGEGRDRKNIDNGPWIARNTGLQATSPSPSTNNVSP